MYADEKTMVLVGSRVPMDAAPGAMVITLGVVSMDRIAEEDRGSVVRGSGLDGEVLSRVFKACDEHGVSIDFSSPAEVFSLVNALGGTVQGYMQALDEVAPKQTH